MVNNQIPKIPSDLFMNYKQNEEENLRKLANKLRKKNFNFGSAKGVPGKKKNSTKRRPIVRRQ